MKYGEQKVPYSLFEIQAINKKAFNYGRIVGFLIGAWLVGSLWLASYVIATS